MPKKRVKSREEKTAEGFFPVDETSLTHTTSKEIPEYVDQKVRSVEIAHKDTSQQAYDDIKTKSEIAYSKPDRKTLETVVKQGTKKVSRKRTTKRTAKKTTKKTSKRAAKSVSFTPQKITLKKSGYELIITEKPQAAQKIAQALQSAGSPKKLSPGGVAYYEVNREGKEIVVSCAVGHLFTLKQEEAGTKLPIFDIQWVPNYMVRKGDFTKKYYDTLLKLAKGAGELTVATDYDVEGEVIGHNVVKYLAGQPDARRMKFSTLTEKELNDAYEKKFEHIDWGQALAGETRHFLDWYYGINVSRALMNAVKATGRFKIMSAGRVQGPALKLIVDKEKEIQAFVPTPYWQIDIDVKDTKGTVVSLRHNKDITDKKDLPPFEKLKGRDVDLETKKSQTKIRPPEPFNLTTLQTEAYRLHGFTPSRTLQIAQSLYLNGIISYPRTSSQKLPASINYKDILNKVALQMKVGPSKLTRTKPVEGAKSDPAHPSIYPTGSVSAMNTDEEKLYKLIAKRFLALFCEDALIDNKNISTIVDGYKFATKGTAIREAGWMDIYPSKTKEKELPDVEKKGTIKKVTTEEKMTQPPKRYTPASIVSELEKRNLGTKATRANIIETLYDRAYIKEKSIEATPLGISLVDTLEKYSPIIVDEQLTRHFEEEMEELQEEKNKEQMEKKEDKVIEEAKDTITKIIDHFEKHDKKIGNELIEATDEVRKQERKNNIICDCPVCREGQLAITYSPKNKRHFIACNAYPKCKTTYSLPPNGTIKKVEGKKDEDGNATLKLCPDCSFPMLMALRPRKKPWIFCFNPECSQNKKRLEEYRKRQADKN